MENYSFSGVKPIGHSVKVNISGLLRSSNGNKFSVSREHKSVSSSTFVSSLDELTVRYQYNGPKAPVDPQPFHPFGYTKSSRRIEPCRYDMYAKRGKTDWSDAYVYRYANPYGSPVQLFYFTGSETISCTSTANLPSSVFAALILEGNCPRPDTVPGLLRRAEEAKASMLVSMAEANETIKYMAEKVKLIASFAAKLKKGQFNAALKTVKPNARLRKKKIAALRKLPIDSRLAKGWLEFRFAIMPLIGDIQDLAEVAADQLTKSKTATIRYKAESTVTRRLKVVGALTFEQRVTRKRKTCISFERTSTSTANQMGLLNVASAAYDLVPFSFVVDRFVNIGDYLESLSDFAGLRFLSGWESESIETINTAICDAKAAQYPWPSSVGSTSWSGVPINTNSPEFLAWRATGGWVPNKSVWDGIAHPLTWSSRPSENGTYTHGIGQQTILRYDRYLLTSFPTRQLELTPQLGIRLDWFTDYVALLREVVFSPSKKGH